MDDRNFKNKGGNFTVVDNELINEKGLTLRAKGLYAYLRSKPDTWHFAAKRIAADSQEGRRAVLTAIKELISFGYLTYEKLPTGRSLYTVLREPLPEAERVLKDKGWRRKNLLSTKQNKPGSLNRTVPTAHRAYGAPISNTVTEKEKKYKQKGGSPPNIGAIPSADGKQHNIEKILSVVAARCAEARIPYKRTKAEAESAGDLLDVRGLEGTLEVVHKAFDIMGSKYAPTAHNMFLITKKAAMIINYGGEYERAPHNGGGFILRADGVTEDYTAR